MPDTRRFCAGLATLLTLVVAQAAPALANPCALPSVREVSEPQNVAPDDAAPDDGMGGTGLRSGGDGMGGTGAGPADGLGGTGVGPGDGMGGTGATTGMWIDLIGTVTGFGSVCVNGRRVGYDDGVAVDIDGTAAGAKELAVGQVVVVRAQIGPNGGLRAKTISVRRAVVGPVTHVASDGRALRVMGQSVHLRPDARVFDANTGRALRTGERVAVSGHRRGDGVLVATRIDAATASTLDVLNGSATAVGSDAFYVGDVRVAGSLPAGARSVQIAGEWDSASRTLRPQQVTVTPALRDGARWATVEGFARGRNANRFHVAGAEVDASGATSQLDPIDASVRIIVAGPVVAPGVIRAERIEVRSSRPNARGVNLESGNEDDRSEREDSSERGDRGEREDRSGRGERPERPERGERAERPERPERAERPERSGRD